MPAIRGQQKGLQFGSGLRRNRCGEHRPNTFLHAAAQPRHVPLQSRHGWQQNLLGNQPSGSTIEQNAGPVSARPAERIQPAVEAKLGSPIAKITEAAMATYLGGVVPARLAFAVVEKATELLDVELPGEAVDDAVRHVRKIFQEGPQEAGGAKLDGKAQSVVATAVGVYEPSITVMKSSCRPSASQAMRNRPLTG